MKLTRQNKALDKGKAKKPTSADSLFSDLFHTHYAELFRLGFRLSANAAFTRDQLQSFFLGLWESDFRPNEVQYPHTYLKKAFYRKMVRALQEEEKLRTLQASLPGLIEPSYESLLIESQELESRRRKLTKELDQLPDAQRKVLSLRFHQGLSYDEIASTTGKSRQTIYNQIHSAVKRLKKLLS